MPKTRNRISVGDASIEDFNAYLDALPWDVAEDLERVTELGFRQWLRLIDSDAAGSIRARRALTWLVLKTAQPHLRYAQVIGAMSDLTIENLAECPACEKETDTGTRSDPLAAELLARLRAQLEGQLDDALVGQLAAHLRDPRSGNTPEQFCITCGYVYPPEVTVEPARPPKAVKSRASKTAADSTEVS